MKRFVLVLVMLAGLTALGAQGLQYVDTSAQNELMDITPESSEWFEVIYVDGDYLDLHYTSSLVHRENVINIHIHNGEDPNNPGQPNPNFDAGDLIVSSRGYHEVVVPAIQADDFIEWALD